jgi:hypothetical protein
MKRERGASLIVALMILSFLTVLGSVLLTTSTIDVWIGDNVNTSLQLLYAAESGLERAREEMRVRGVAPDTLLASASGPNGSLMDSNDLDVLLAGDDRPMYPVGADGAGRLAGEPHLDGSGRELGRYWVWLRNDPADGRTTTVDHNQVLNLVSIARKGSARKTIEWTVRKGRFPRLPAAVTFDGTVGLFVPGAGAFRIDGNDPGGAGAAAIGVIDDGSVGVVTDAIPAERTNEYAGVGGERPGVRNIDGEMEPKLKTPRGLEGVVSSMSASATDVYSPPYGSTRTLGNVGSPDDYRVVMVHGDCNLRSGAGYGLLVVWGDLTVGPGFIWHGVIIVIGQGVLNWTGGYGEVHGGVFLAKTRGPRTPADPLGPVLESRGIVAADFSGAAGGIWYDAGRIAAANSRFPYTAVSMMEY